jgi:hypothetical protein
MHSSFYKRVLGLNPFQKLSFSPAHRPLEKAANQRGAHASRDGAAHIFDLTPSVDHTKRPRERTSCVALNQIKRCALLLFQCVKQSGAKRVVTHARRRRRLS